MMQVNDGCTVTGHAELMFSTVLTQSMEALMKVLAFVGYSGSGKTTLLENSLPA